MTPRVFVALGVDKLRLVLRRLHADAVQNSVIDAAPVAEALSFLFFIQLCAAFSPLTSTSSAQCLCEGAWRCLSRKGIVRTTPPWSPPVKNQNLRRQNEPPSLRCEATL